jgi:transposase
MMMPPDLRDWLPDGHLAYQVSDLVDAMDLSAFYAPYEGDGRRNRPYEPRMMAKLLLYGYAVGVISSRRIAERLRRDVAFRCLAATDRLPAHRTICEFRRRHLEDFRDLFVQVLRIAGEMGLTSLGTLAVDASKVKASASRRKAMTYGRMQQEELRLRGEIDALLERAEAVDIAEDERYGEDSDGDDTPHELRRRRSRLAKIEQAKARLEMQARRFDDARGRRPGQVRNPGGGRPYKRAYGEPDPKSQSNFTDPESSIMQTSTEGFQQAYNAQAAVDSESRLIVAADVSANASDSGQLLPMVEQASRNTAVPAWSWPTPATPPRTTS